MRPRPATATEPVTGYQHRDHAGNFADVHKHVLLRMLLRELKRGPAPLTYLESHAGAGFYKLEPGGAWEDGLGRLLGRDDLPEPVADYVASCGDGYPGSPLHAAKQLSSEDRLVLVERDADTGQRLAARIARDAYHVVRIGDGFDVIRTNLPAKDEHGLLLVDPPYVDEGDYAAVAALLTDVASMWPAGVLVAWYPRWRDRREQTLHQRLGDSGQPGVLDTWIGFDRDGMSGSGVLVINPPTGVDTEWASVNRWLAKTLARRSAWQSFSETVSPQHGEKS